MSEKIENWINKVHCDQLMSQLIRKQDELQSNAAELKRLREGIEDLCMRFELSANENVQNIMLELQQLLQNEKGS